MRSGLVGILMTMLGVVVALCAWLFPFQPIRPSPFDKTPEEPKRSSPAKPSGLFPDGKAGYYLIGYTTDNQEVAVHESQRQNQNGFHTHVAYSSNWSGFTPSLYIVIYGIYDSKESAVAALTQVEAQGVNACVKHSGNRVH